MSRTRIIEVANGEIGVKEDPPGSNRTKYGAWYGWDGYKWCAMFVSWVYNRAGHPLGKIDDNKGYRGCQSGYNHWRANGELVKEPKPGDIVLFDWDGNGICDHTGIFVSWVEKGKTFNSIEGNTAFRNDSDGGGVMMRSRSVQSVRAFVGPKILGGGIDENRNILIKGDKGSEVVDLQRTLYELGYKVDIDGYFGPKTADVVKQFQKNYALPIDGTVTPALRGLMQEELFAKTVPESQLTNGSYLQKGDTGYAVTVLQKALNKKYTDLGLAEDGMFGVKTLMALKKFQKDYELVIDGVAGPETFNALGIKLI